MSTEWTAGVDRAAGDAIKSTRRAASQALDTMADTAKDVRSDIAPSVKRAAEHAKALGQIGMEAVRDGSVQLRGHAKRASETTVAYIKDEPVKAMVIAAAAGAALMALLRVSTRSRADD